jgi:DNA-binding cell septation regulator SpoVG
MAELILTTKVENAGETIQTIGSMRKEIKDLRSQMLNASEEEFVLLSKRASELQAQIGRTNGAITSSGSAFTNFSTILGRTKNALLRLDFGAAQEGLSAMATSIKNMSWKDFTKGIKSATLGIRQLTISMLANPIFLLAAVIGGVVIAIVTLKDDVMVLGMAFDFMKGVIDIVVEGLKTLTDWLGLTSFAADESSRKIVEGLEKQRKALNEQNEDLEVSISSQIKIYEALGLSTEALNRQMLENKRFSITESIRLDQLEINELTQKQSRKRRLSDDERDRLNALIEKRREYNREIIKLDTDLTVLEIKSNKEKNDEMLKASKMRFDMEKSLRALELSLEVKYWDGLSTPYSKYMSKITKLNADERELYNDLRMDKMTTLKQTEDNFNRDIDLIRKKGEEERKELIKTKKVKLFYAIDEQDDFEATEESMNRLQKFYTEFSKEIAELDGKMKKIVEDKIVSPLVVSPLVLLPSGNEQMFVELFNRKEQIIKLRDEMGDVIKEFNKEIEKNNEIEVKNTEKTNKQVEDLETDKDRKLNELRDGFLLKEIEVSKRVKINNEDRLKAVRDYTKDERELLFQFDKERVENNRVRLMNEKTNMEDVLKVYENYTKAVEEANRGDGMATPGQQATINRLAAELAEIEKKYKSHYDKLKIIIDEENNIIMNNTNARFNEEEKSTKDAYDKLIIANRGNKKLVKELEERKKEDLLSISTKRLLELERIEIEYNKKISDLSKQKATDDINFEKEKAEMLKKIKKGIKEDELKSLIEEMDGYKQPWMDFYTTLTDTEDRFFINAEGNVEKYSGGIARMVQNLSTFGKASSDVFRSLDQLAQNDIQNMYRKATLDGELTEIEKANIRKREAEQKRFAKASILIDSALAIGQTTVAATRAAASVTAPPPAQLIAFAGTMAGILPKVIGTFAQLKAITGQTSIIPNDISTGGGGGGSFGGAGGSSGAPSFDAYTSGLTGDNTVSGNQLIQAFITDTELADAEQRRRLLLQRGSL